MMGGEFPTEKYFKSIRGASHEISGLPCQDSSGCFQTEKYTLIVVSDGHGSAPHFRSNIGSELAVEATDSIIRESMQHDDFMGHVKDDPEGSMHHLCNAVIASWRLRVEDHIRDNHLTPTEQEIIKKEGLDESDPVKWYGATLIACVISDDIVFGFQIGDGDLVIIHDSDGPIRPIPEDEGCFLNRTTSICASDASMNFRSFTTFPRGGFFKYPEKDPNVFRYVPIQPTSVRGAIVCTDGLTTSFNSEESFLRYCVPACESILTPEGLENLYKNLVLRSRSNAQDDVSVAIVIRSEIRSEGPSSNKSPNRPKMFLHKDKAHEYRKKKGKRIKRKSRRH